MLWLTDVLKPEATRLVFVDESGFQLNMTPSYAHTPKGERAYGRVPKNRGENTSLRSLDLEGLSLLAAISLDEGVSAR